MNNFDLIVIGACHGFWLENDIKKCSNKILLIEPVKYNFDQLKNRFKNYKNIIFENIAIGEKNELIDFFHVLESSIDKLKKHWSSGIGSFSKEHILNHRTKRFLVTEKDIKCIKVKAMTFNKLIEKYKVDPELKHFFIGKRNYIKMLEKEEEVINECLNSVEKTETYLLTNKSFNIKKNIEKKDIENKIFEYLNTKNE